MEAIILFSLLCVIGIVGIVFIKIHDAKRNHPQHL